MQKHMRMTIYQTGQHTLGSPQVDVPGKKLEVIIIVVITFVDIGYGTGVSVDFYRDVLPEGLLLGVEKEGGVHREGFGW